jgi:hypothetical protein
VKFGYVLTAEDGIFSGNFFLQDALKILGLSLSFAHEISFKLIK